ncbi:MAG: short-chain dehydrogenase, partial [Mycobacterium sp.]
PVRTGVLESLDATLVDKLVPDYLWISAEHAAKASLDGLARNKMRVIPGIPAKAMSVANQYLPRSIVTPVVGSFYKKLDGR